MADTTNNTDNQTRTVSGFQEFIHNGKQSVCEDTDKTVKKKVVLRRHKK